MNNHKVSVSQLQSYRGAFLNVTEKEGHIGVWTSTHNAPTFLVFMESNPYFIQFEDMDWAKEWFKHWEDWIIRVFRVRTGGLSEVSYSEEKAAWVI